MTTNELATLVAMMRNAQKKYFRTRGAGDLNESKRLEKLVDQVVADAMRRPELFDAQK